MPVSACFCRLELGGAGCATRMPLVGFGGDRQLAIGAVWVSVGESRFGARDKEMPRGDCVVGRDGFFAWACGGGCGARGGRVGRGGRCAWSLLDLFVGVVEVTRRLGSAPGIGSCRLCPRRWVEVIPLTGCWGCGPRTLGRDSRRGSLHPACRCAPIRVGCRWGWRRLEGARLCVRCPQLVLALAGIGSATRAAWCLSGI